MSCSGKADCRCDDCEDDGSDSDHLSKGPRILDHLPTGAIPASQYRNGIPLKCAPPINRSVPSGAERPMTLSVPVYPLNNLIGLESGTTGRISITFLHQNGLTTFAWEQFQGQLGSRGLVSVSLSTTLPFLPVYQINVPIIVVYNGLTQTGRLHIDPNAAIDAVKFYFNVAGQANSLYGDIVQIQGGTVSYINRQC